MSDESLFREVDEEVRQEQFKKLWARFGNLVIGVCLLVILGVGGYQGWHYWQKKQSQAAGDAYFSAAELGIRRQGRRGAEAVRNHFASGLRGSRQDARGGTARLPGQGGGCREDL